MAMLCVLAIQLAGCAPRGPQGGPYTLNEPPTYAELAEKHNARVALLDTLYADGVVEVRWTDEDGKHFEQGDLDVWLHMPNETALQVSKLGERFFWLGCNARASWVFDLRTEGATFAEINGPTANAAPAGETSLAISMTSILEMMGLGTIPAEPPADADPVRYDKKTKAWVLSTQGSIGPMRFYFDERRVLPIRIELLSLNEGDEPAVELTSTLQLQRYEYVSIVGESPDKYPLVPTLIDIVRADGSGSIKIGVTRPVTRDASFRDEYFQLPWLIEALQPDEVRDYRSPGATP